MAVTRKELKDNAKQSLRGNWGWAIIVFLITAIIVGIFTGAGHWLDETYINYDGTNIFYQFASPIGSILLWIGSFIGLSRNIAFLELRDDQKEEKPYMAAFSVFTENRFGPELINFVLVSIFTFLWTWLLIIPGIIKAYSYSMTPYIVKDMVASDKQVGATDGINASKELMKSHKMDLFIFDLSFLGWNILAAITCGIGYLWVTPYYQTAKANFYRHIAGDKFLK
ncbi:MULTISPECIES: DUF975 family protein [Lactobacillus]|uniref:DUF975 family protein n=1 Tax=Lactobacillus TaxID=1578 RepID=UPI000BEEAA0B|nr:MULTISPECIES: DUF975 family protein [Lactobacillus]MBM6957979.1 DUF975 family protein [Lactobacillus gallinarum]PEG87437.1 hypothetical protein CP365_02525 [Lactobacillus sp. UMNPBX14]PEH02986.1 hypothetical protein CP357_02525 [Lactobacillus sp. UMNPBX6]